MANISNQALDIISQKPRFWQHKLFCQVLTDEIGKCADARKSHRKGLPSLPKMALGEREFPGWFSKRMHEQAERIRRFCESWKLLAGLSFGETGAEADVAYMVDFAVELGAGYCAAIEWSQGFRSLSLTPMHKPLLKEVVAYSNNYIETIETLPGRVMEQLALFENAEVYGPFAINVTVEMTPHNSQALQKESDLFLAKYKRRFNIQD